MNSARGASDAGQTTLTWDLGALKVRQRATSLACFGALYVALVFLGYGLRENHEQLTIIWPAAGLLVMALWSTAPRNWVWILAVQLVAEIAVDCARSDRFSLQWSTLFAAADSVDAIIGASIAKRLIAEPDIPRIRQVLQFFGAVALGAAASAIPGAIGAAHTLAGADYLHQWQLWWAGNWLGSLSVAPVALTWAVRWRAPELSVRSFSMVELTIIGSVLSGAAVWLFSAPPGGLTTILDAPVVLLALLMVAAFRLPPRWATTLAAVVVIVAAFYAGNHSGPFAGDSNPFARVAGVQLYLATLVIATFTMSIVLLEMRTSLQLLKTSEERYRNFVERSSEAVWRIELDPPLPPGLALEAQTAWLHRHAYIAECNLAYHRLNKTVDPSGALARRWRADVPWSAIYLEHLGKAANRNYSMDGLKFVIQLEGRPATYLTAFGGVIENDCLTRIWGVARDVTELVELNLRLRREQERLQAYARELVGAEERARRATAVDLNDGIGRKLVSLGTTLDTASPQSPRDMRQLLGEARQTVREMQEMAERVVADLSPPGLYDLGLKPALQWLSVYLRGKEQLQVTLQLEFDESAIGFELRILVYTLISELLRNVVKHAQVQSATVTVKQTPNELRTEVADQGVGFEWQLDLFEVSSRSLGLWSVADRVHAAGGTLSIDTAPGLGCKVSMTFPRGPRPL